jgi:hypothetical protein
MTVASENSMLKHNNNNNNNILLSKHAEKLLSFYDKK